MAKAKKSIYFCQNCGHEESKWLGQCPMCREWNTFVEEKVTVSKGTAAKNTVREAEVVTLSSVSTDQEDRMQTEIEELDRVLGGGVVPGSLVLVGGDPGIGKSTLLLQVCKRLSDQGRKVLYISGEESLKQIKLRANRMGTFSDHLLLLCETNLETIRQVIEREHPAVAVIDSIQTMYMEALDSAPGSVSQVRACGNELMRVGKTYNIPIFIVAHVTKSGELAGPKIVEHLVDCVLHFTGERNQELRILRAFKNRFGTTSEIGAFEMAEEGLIEIENLSKSFLEGMEEGAEGSMAGAVYEGTRPLLLEVQALAAPTNVGFARRSAIGVELSRLNMILAVLERKAGLSLINQDIYVNIVGGLRPEGTSVDLAVALAIYSTCKGIPCSGKTIAIGEIGLTGDLRSVQNSEKIAREAARMGFERILMPEKNAAKLKAADVAGIRIVGVKRLADAIREF